MTVLYTQQSRWAASVGTAVCATFSLAGCASIHSAGADYTPPPAATLLPATAWQASLPHDGHSHTLLNGWRDFNDPLLDELLKHAEASSPTLAAAVARIDEARAGLGLQAAAGWPGVQLGVHQLRNNGSADFPATAQTTRGSSLDAQWEIDLFGRVRRGHEAATARLESRAQGWHAAQISLAAEVTGRYVSYRACQLTLRALAEDVQSREDTARLTMLSAQAGIAAPADAELARASHAETQSMQVAQEASCDILRKTLVTLSGMPEAALQSLLERTATTQAQGLPTPTAFKVDSLPTALLAQRPDLAAAERDLAAASADIGIATANRYPRLALIGNLTRDRSGDQPSYLSKPWLFGPSLSLPLFDGGALAAQQEAARARYAQTLAHYRQAVLGAVEEVETALVQLDAARRRTDHAQTATLGYRAYFQAAEQHWRAGGLSLLALEEARRHMNAARRNEIALQRDQVLHWIALYKALGGNWQATAATNAPPTPTTTPHPHTPPIPAAPRAGASS